MTPDFAIPETLDADFDFDSLTTDELITAFGVAVYLMAVDDMMAALDEVLG